MNRLRSRRHHVEHDNVHRWLVSYADYMTLLFALFVVLYAMAMIHEKPFESVAKGYVYLKAEANTTKATWGFQSEMPYPLNISILFMDMEKNMGDDWRKALNALKTMSEKDFELQSMEQ